MSKAPTISLPFTNYDVESTKKPWYNVFSGSRLRNRILAMLSAAGLFLVGVWLLHQTFFGGSDATIVTSIAKSGSAISALQPYDGVDPKTPLAENLIIVAGHAIWRGGSTYQNESDWYLEPYQVGETPTLVEHIKQGAVQAKKTAKSLLIFSGGNTRLLAGARTESQSYEELLELLAKTDTSLQVQSVTTEEFARDSYENLLFSVARFYEVVGRYPKTIAVVGYSFKQTRYKDLHRKAIRFPVEHFSYHGIDPPGLDRVGLEGEWTNAISHFESDLYGCKDADLLRKKKNRNPYRRRHGYEVTNPEMAALFAYCPGKGDEVFPGKLPWS